MRLNITTEGPTERNFAIQTLAPYLSYKGIFVVARNVLMSTEHRVLQHRGGLTNYAKAKNDIVQWLKEENRSADVRFTTMFDYYALPNDFPGTREAEKLFDPYDKVKCIEDAMNKDIADSRFFAYIQLHEFESLVLAQPERLLEYYIGEEKALKALVDDIKDNNPELINTVFATSPSHRIAAHFDGYNKDKATLGPMIAGGIGVDTLTAKCRHFREWIEQIKSLVP